MACINCARHESTAADGCEVKILDSNAIVPETKMYLISARVAELADAYASGAYEATRVGSSPTPGTLPQTPLGNTRGKQ